MWKELKIRTFIVVVAIALLTGSAHAQGMGKGKKHQQDTQKTEDKTKGSSGNRVDESNEKCGLKPHGYWVFEVS
jgi:hypothetical protein